MRIKMMQGTGAKSNFCSYRSYLLWNEEEEQFAVLLPVFNTGLCQVNLGINYKEQGATARYLPELTHCIST